jgi:Na+-transporting methylmalonyl-CoA/oxaloacetate decarboxylase beta subunit
MLHTVMCNVCTAAGIYEPEWLNIIQMHIFMHLLFVSIFKESTPTLCLTMLVGNTLVHNIKQLPDTQ